jgi:hypothetical protein
MNRDDWFEAQELLAQVGADLRVMDDVTPKRNERAQLQAYLKAQLLVELLRPESLRGVPKGAA